MLAAIFAVIAATTSITVASDSPALALSGRRICSYVDGEFVSRDGLELEKYVAVNYKKKGDCPLVKKSFGDSPAPLEPVEKYPCEAYPEHIGIIWKKDKGFQAGKYRGTINDFNNWYPSDMCSKMDVDGVYNFYVVKTPPRNDPNGRNISINSWYVDRPSEEDGNAKDSIWDYRGNDGEDRVIPLASGCTKWRDSNTFSLHCDDRAVDRIVDYQSLAICKNGETAAGTTVAGGSEGSSYAYCSSKGGLSTARGAFIFAGPEPPPGCKVNSGEETFALSCQGSNIHEYIAQAYCLEGAFTRQDGTPLLVNGSPYSISSCRRYRGIKAAFAKVVYTIF